ncbi:Na-translocating system protein MpsC family protein [Zhaonella formicivorans]|uniref:Na-translocating system protein MpsC family protein n=1 Tax=Zhaonella formicivorans TaxID=2528593 RepID=UPI0010DD6088|nr:Na-translocating system protein MpsC family protein [Zhaonella formicivorans]
MAKNKAELESALRRMLSRLHQEIFGKGPEGVWVKITQNVGTFYVSKTLTNMELFLLSVPGGEDEVLRLRGVIMKNIKPRLYSEIEHLGDVKVISIATELSIISNAFFGAILFDRSFD